MWRSIEPAGHHEMLKTAHLSVHIHNSRADWVTSASANASLRFGILRMRHVGVGVGNPPDVNRRLGLPRAHGRVANGD
jgi:hypothetical protein